MPALTLDVPPDRRDDLLRVLLSLYSLKAEAVHLAADDYVNNERSLPALIDHRAELAAIDDLIEQLGWRLNLPAHPARLTGDGHLLAEVSHGALDDAVDDLRESLSTPAAGPKDVESIGRLVRRVNALFALLQTIYRPASSPA
jgi:hypothetical protein